MESNYTPDRLYTRNVASALLRVQGAFVSLGRIETKIVVEALVWLIGCAECLFQHNPPLVAALWRGTYP